VKLLKWTGLGCLGLVALLVLFVGCAVVIGTLQGPSYPPAPPDGADIRLTEQHRAGDVRWADYMVIEPYASRSDELAAARYIRDHRAKPYDLVYVLYKEAAGSGAGSYAVIVRSEAGLEKDAEIARFSTQHDEAIKAWRNKSNIYLWHFG